MPFHRQRFTHQTLTLSASVLIALCTWFVTSPIPAWAGTVLTPVQPETTTINGVTWIQVASPNNLLYIDENQFIYLNANIELTKDIDMSSVPNWTPFGGNAYPDFTGTFNGNHHKVAGINISGVANGGFIGSLGSKGTLENLGIQASVSGGQNEGGLVGVQNGGSIDDSCATGSASGTSGSNNGGLVGDMERGDITDSYATGSASGGPSSENGGLVGLQWGGSIRGSFATGSVSAWGGNNSGSRTGGLVGEVGPTGNVTESFATGSASGGSYNGGLVGYLGQGDITNSHATGSASGGSYSFNGGLVGFQDGNIIDSYANGSASGGSKSDNGGLVGSQTGGENITTNRSYATGSASGTSDSYNGGLVGYLDYGSINDSYAAGSASGGTGSDNGGLVGAQYGGPISDAYYVDLSGTTPAVGTGSSNGISGLTAVQMTLPGSYVGWDFAHTWTIDPMHFINSGFPFLQSNVPMPSLFPTAIW